jgi:succinate dehydrogenase hydrophobic anchor subunit
MSVIETPTAKRRATPEPRADGYQRERSARVWHWTAGSGMALLVLATMHIVAQHFVVDQKGGLRTYHEVLTYVANPIIFILEAGFLVAVTIHGMLGIRSVLYDRSPGPTTRQRIDRGLWVIGTLTVAYGMALLITLAARS